MEESSQNVDELSKPIVSTIKKIGYDINQLSKKQITYLEKIDAAIKRIFQKEEQARAMLVGNDVNVANIAREIGVSRQTIYNNRVLEDYINHYAEQFEHCDASSKYQGLVEENRYLRREIAELHKHDFEHEELRLSYENALEEVKRLKEMLELYQKGVIVKFDEARTHMPRGKNKNKNLSIVTWNVNGLKACVDNGFFDFFTKVKPDIICLQETKVFPENVTFALEGYYLYLNPSKQRGYSGTAVFTNQKPLNVYYGFGNEYFDNEGRIITLEFETFYLLNCYTPVSRIEFTQQDMRIEWEDLVRTYVLKLEKDKPVILCGDLNVAYQEIDTEYLFDKSDTKPITMIEREKMSELLSSGYDDAFRIFHPNDYHIFSWWPYYDDCRKKNYGLRLDYFITSTALRKRLVDVKYHTSAMGSDHCPVELIIRHTSET